MDLSDLTLDELCELRTGLEIVESAVRTMHDLTEDVVVTIGSEHIVITSGPILRRASAEVIERFDDDATFAEEMLDPCLPDRAPNQVPKPRSGQTSANRAMERCVGPDGLVRGPWLEEEDTLLVSLRARGNTYSACAEALGRPVAATGFHARGLKDRIEAEAAALTEAAASDPVVPRTQVFVAEMGAALSDPKTPAGGADAPQSAPADAGPAGAPASRQTPAGGAASAPAPPEPQGLRSAQGIEVSVVPEDLRGIAREIWLRIVSDPPDATFDAELDLDLAEGLVAGRALAEIALDLDLDAAACKRRWTHLKAPIVDARGQVTISGQEALLVVLRRRAMLARGHAA